MKSLRYIDIDMLLSAYKIMRRRALFLISLVLINLLYAVVTSTAGELTINKIILCDKDSGSQSYTNSYTIDVIIDYNGTPSDMLLSENADFDSSRWILFSKSFTFSFSTLEGQARTLYCKLRDASGESNIAKNTICLDVQPPALSPVYTRFINATHVEVCIGEPMIDGDNISNYSITGGIEVIFVQSLPVGSGHAYEHSYMLLTTPHTAGMQYVLTVSDQLRDLAGNPIDPGNVAFSYIASGESDTTPPKVERFVIAQGSGYTNKHVVDVSIMDSDKGGIVDRWLIREVDSLSPLSVPLEGDLFITERPRTFTLSEGEGRKILVAWVMDDSGNVSSLSRRSRDSVILDMTPPVADVGGDKNVKLGDIITFDASLSSDNYNISKYTWDFGDDWADEGITTIHKYKSPGTYEVTLSVYDSAGNGPVLDRVHVYVDEPDIEVGGSNSDFGRISDAIETAEYGSFIYVYTGSYSENLRIDKGIILRGEDSLTTVIEGNIYVEETNAVIDGFTILSEEGDDSWVFTNEYYDKLTLGSSAAVTAVNSSVIVRNCIISSGGFGRTDGIRVLNLYQNRAISPLITDNIIKGTSCGIFYFSQSSGGEISGSIKNNTLCGNENGIILRMRKECPEIKNNIISEGTRGIVIVYEEGSLLDERKARIHHNNIWETPSPYWLDASDAEIPMTGIHGNIAEEPLFVDTSGGNYTLLPESYCTGAADDYRDPGRAPVFSAAADAGYKQPAFFT
ncbi:MAG: PKD domain-containing protein [Candidatus Omnitrophica bacterium]|nr:PKD domain-containing protein [Candidatus Omnitrophota bacterium]